MNCVSPQDVQLVRLAEMIAQKVGPQRFHVWFNNSTRLDLKNDGLEIAVPNDFISEWITTHFKKPIQEAASEVLGCSLPVRFSVMPELFSVAQQTATVAASGAVSAKVDRVEPARVGRGGGVATPVLPAPATPAADPRFDPRPALVSSAARRVEPTGKARLRHELETFIVGPSNHLAYNAATYVAEFPGVQYNPLFIHGSCGLGKTHLLQGLCRQFISHHPAKRWVYITAEEFTNEFIVAVRGGKLDSFRRRFRDLDLMVIDDIHFFAGKKATQEEFLHTFNAIEAMGRQVVLASDAHPKMIAEFGESLVNRFVSGMVVRIDPPNCATRCEILKAIAMRSRAELPADVIEWVARRVTQNVRELEGAVNRIVAHATLTGRRPDVAMAQAALADLDRAMVAPLKTDSIMLSVCEYFGLEMRDLMSGRRQRTISLARSVAMFLVRRTGKLSFPEIGAKMGNRNHSTVISACRRIEEAVTKNEMLSWTSAVGDRSEEAGEVIARLEEQARAGV